MGKTLLFLCTLLLLMAVGPFAQAFPPARPPLKIVETPATMIAPQYFCDSIDYSVGMTYYFRLNDPYGDDEFGQRFTPSGADACTLKAANIGIYGTQIKGNPGMLVTVYADDGSGLPGLNLGSVSVPSGSIPHTGAYYLAVNLSSLGLTFAGQDFHIGVAKTGSAGDTLTILSDDGSAGTLRSWDHWGGAYHYMFADWAQDVNFVIGVELCCAETYSVTFSQLDFILNDTPTVNSDWGAVDLDFIGSDTIFYLNLVVNGSWQIQNMPLQSIEGAGIPQAQRFNFDLGNAVGINVSSINYGISLGSAILSTPPAGTSTAAVSGDSVIIGESGGESVFRPSGAAALIGGAVLDAIQHVNKGFPNQEAGDKECVPAAVSNSLQYLNGEHKMGMNPADITIDKMKAACGFIGGWGCLRDTWWSDKDTYMKNNKLPITTRKFPAGDMGKIQAEIDIGQDIEIEMFGHTAAVTGVKDLGGGKYSITVSHDIKQGEAGGTVTETGTYDANTRTLTGITGGNGVNYFVVECPRKPDPGGWNYHPMIVNGWMTVYGTIDCTIIVPPLFPRQYVYWCHQYSGTLPPEANDYLVIFEWDASCHNVDRIKVAVPYYDLYRWRLRPLLDWLKSIIPLGDSIVLPGVGDSTGVIQNVYVMINPEEWLGGPQMIHEIYSVVNGTCPHLPGYLLSTTPFIFDSLAGPPMPSPLSPGPFSYTPLTGILYHDADLTLTPPGFVCGDADGSGGVNILDVSFVVSYLYKGGPAPNPSVKADVDHSGAINILDVGYTISYLYKGGPAPNCP